MQSKTFDGEGQAEIWVKLKKRKISCFKPPISFLSFGGENQPFLLLLHSRHPFNREESINPILIAHETEAGTTCARIALNFEHQDESSSQIIVQKDVLTCISLY